MINENALVVYKGKIAIVKERTGASSDNKYNITLIYGTQAKVREKDIEMIHPGPVKNFDGISMDESVPNNAPVREVWELLSDEDGSPLTLKELAGFLYSEYTPVNAASAYRVLQDGLFFSGTINSIVLRSKDEVKTEETKRKEKIRDGEERSNFLERCRKNQLTKDDLLQAARFMQDVEALAYGKSIKSRTMKELKLNQTPEDAHDLLLKTGIWTPMINPYPVRFGINLTNPVADFNSVEENPELNRIDLCRLETFAIDSPWTGDPDDAVSIETNNESMEYILYVHVADPASFITPDSPIEKEARDRGATLYLPEITVRMLPEECLYKFALGLNEKSIALSFKMTINKEGDIINTEIFPSLIKVTRITYMEADSQIETNASLRALNELTQILFKRRCKNGAINIDLPDVHICIENETVKIEPVPQYRSAVLIRECMIAAGVGAGTWASEKNIPLPYLSQEAEIPGTVLPGLAGSMQLRKGMRSRVISVKPGRHQGMGLDHYTQVTSPLRRYTDLLAHMQIRSYLCENKPLGEKEVSARFGYSEAAITACVQTERATDIHWKMVYLKDKKDSVWNAVVVEKRMKNWLVIIPDLALETVATLPKDTALNDEVSLVLKSVNIPRADAVFVSG